MAKFKAELPLDLIHQLEDLNKNTEKMMGEMTRAGAEVAYNNIKKNIQGSFKNPSKILSGLKITKTYKTPSNGAIGNFVGFYGYLPFSNPNRKTFSRKGKSGKTYTTTEGVPIDFLVQLAEYGSSKITAKPFVRKSFKKKEIEKAMLEVQKKYIGE